MKSVVRAVVLMLGLAACGTDTESVGSQGSDVATTTPTPTGDPGTPSGAQSGNAAEPAVAKELKFKARSLDGGTFDGAALAGKDTVLWFWAPWCTECRREAPFVAKAQAENADVVFVGVAGLGETDAMRDFVEDYDVGGFEHLADLDGSLWQRFKVIQQPAYAFIDSTGEVEVVRGELGEDGITKHVAELTRN